MTNIWTMDGKYMRKRCTRLNYWCMAGILGCPGLNVWIPSEGLIMPFFWVTVSSEFLTPLIVQFDVRVAHILMLHFDFPPFFFEFFLLKVCQAQSYEWEKKKRKEEVFISPLCLLTTTSICLLAAWDIYGALLQSENPCLSGYTWTWMRIRCFGGLQVKAAVVGSCVELIYEFWMNWWQIVQFSKYQILEELFK